MLSQYLRTRKKDDVVAIFHELHPDPIYCSTDQWIKITKGVTKGMELLINGLKKRKLIIKDLEDDQYEFKKVVTNFEHKLNQPTILYLMTSQECNLKCKYCPVPETSEKHKDLSLSIEDAIAGIDLWQEHLSDVYDPDLQYFVIFYGGEPLLNKEVIRSSLDYLKMKKESNALPSNINFMIATNGILIDEEIISMCKKYEVMVTVGLDGPKDINDVFRIDDNGNGTFNRIITSIKLLVRNKIKTSVSVSITPSNIHKISQYSSFFSKLGIEKFGFNFLKGRLLIDLVGKDKLKDYYRLASRGIIENARNQELDNFEYQMEKKQTAFNNKDFYPVDCTCYGNQLVVQSNGQLSNCPFYEARLGYIGSVNKDFRIWDQPIVKDWRKKLPIYHSGEAKALDGGGCMWGSSELNNGLFTIDYLNQIFSEEVLDELIWSRYQKT